MTLLERTLPGLHESLFAALPVLPRGPVLDVGCGSGAWLSRFKGRELIGVDADSTQLRASDVLALEWDLDRDIPDLGPRKFALISAIEVIEHLENPGHLLRIAARYLADDGFFLLTTPNVHSPIARMKWFLTGRLRFFDEASDPTHISPVILPWIERVLPRHGLRVSRLWCHPQRGTRAARGSVALWTRVLDHLVPGVLLGDTLCLLATRNTSRPT